MRSTNAVRQVARLSLLLAALASASTLGAQGRIREKGAMGIDVVDLTRGMRRYGTFWNCGYVPSDATTLPGVSVQLTVASASEAESTFDRLTRAMRIARGPSAQPDALQLGDRAMAYGTPSGAVAVAVAGDRLYIVETMYGTAGEAFRDKENATIELLRKMIP